MKICLVFLGLVFLQASAIPTESPAKSKESLEDLVSGLVVLLLEDNEVVGIIKMLMKNPKIGYEYSKNDACLECHEDDKDHWFCCVDDEKASLVKGNLDPVENLYTCHWCPENEKDKPGCCQGPDFRNFQESLSKINTERLMEPMQKILYKINEIIMSQLEENEKFIELKSKLLS